LDKSIAAISFLLSNFHCSGHLIVFIPPLEKGGGGDFEVGKIPLDSPEGVKKFSWLQIAGLETTFRGLPRFGSQMAIRLAS
jgi:hypothetical protein